MGKVGSTHIWLDKTFDETLRLLEEAKNYHAHVITRQVRHLVPVERLDVTTESLRVTTRLSHTMAWLISEKAILNEEIDRAELQDRYPPLSEEEVCMNTIPQSFKICPRGLQSLLRRSLDLFERAARLEQMLRENNKTVYH
jgi:regulator of CtrA degradation